LITKTLRKTVLPLVVLGACAPAAADECVVLLHGLWRSDNSMNRMEESLAEAGYRVRNIEYESTERPVEVLAEEAVTAGLEACGDAATVHFVTHSMGGILVRHYLEEKDIDHLGRVVMLGPPNQGSEVIDRYADWPGFEWFSGPAGMQLGTGEASLPRSLGPAHFDVGIIAGNRSLPLIFARQARQMGVQKHQVGFGFGDHAQSTLTARRTAWVPG